MADIVTKLFNLYKECSKIPLNVNLSLEIRDGEEFFSFSRLPSGSRPVPSSPGNYRRNQSPPTPRDTRRREAWWKKKKKLLESQDSSSPCLRSYADVLRGLPKPKPKWETVPKPDPVPTSGPELNTASSPGKEHAPIPDYVSGPDPIPANEPEPAPDPVGGPEPEPAPDLAPEPEPGPDPEPSPGQEAEPDHVNSAGSELQTDPPTSLSDPVFGFCDNHKCRLCYTHEILVPLDMSIICNDSNNCKVEHWLERSLVCKYSK